MAGAHVLALAGILAAALGSSGAGVKASAISAAAARTKAIGVLRGDPYGKTDAEVASHITAQTLGPDTHCQSGKAAWTFTVVVPPGDASPEGIRGYLVLDARTGRMICAGLPFVD